MGEKPQIVTLIQKINMYRNLEKIAAKQCNRIAIHEKKWSIYDVV